VATAIDNYLNIYMNNALNCDQIDVLRNSGTMNPITNVVH
jgi:hypothetical protein